jgi:hypothetical protein
MNLLSRVFEHIGKILSDHPLGSLLIIALLLVVAVNGATGLTSVSGDRAFNGETATADDFRSSFERGVIVVFVDGDTSDPATMRAIDRFDRRASDIKDVETVVSPADHLRRQQGRIPGSKAAIEDATLSSDSALISVITETDLAQKEETSVYESAVEAKEWAQFPAGTEVIVSGDPAFNAQQQNLIQSSTRNLLALAVGLMIVALYFLFRGVRLRLLPIVAVFIGVIYTFGTMGYLSIPNSTVTSAVFPILIGLGIDYSVQLHQRYEEELAHSPPSRALPRALAGIGPPVLVAMLAAALGFTATWLRATNVLAVDHTPAIVWFAQTSIIGVLLTFLTALLVLVPAITLYVRLRGGENASADGTRREGASEDAPTAASGDGTADRDGTDEGVGRYSRGLSRLSGATATHPGIVIAIAGLLMTYGFYAGTSLDTLADPEEFSPDDLPALLDLQQVRDQADGGSNVQYSVLVSGRGLTDPETLRWMMEFDRVARNQPQVEAVDTPADAVLQHDGGSLPTTKTGVERAVERMPDRVRLSHYNEGFAHIIINSEPNLEPGDIVSMRENTEASLELSQPPPGIEAEIAGSSFRFPRSVLDQINNRNLTTMVGLILVFGLLLLYYRHPVKSVAPLVPIVFIVGWQGLYMSALGIKVSPLGASLGALTVGIGAEYTIVVMERYYEEKEDGASPIEAIQTASERVGKAITVSGLTTVVGFSALLLSPFPIASDFGFLTVGVIFMTLVGALLVMPPVLVLLDSIAADLRRMLDERLRIR